MFEIITMYMFLRLKILHIDKYLNDIRIYKQILAFEPFFSTYHFLYFIKFCTSMTQIIYKYRSGIFKSSYGYRVMGVYFI